MTNARLPTRGLFVTGTDTGVGKTYVTSLIASDLLRRGRKVGAYKPACSGAVIDAEGNPVWEDAEVLSRAIGGAALDLVSPQRFLAPLAPNVAARHEGKKVDAQRLRTGALPWLRTADILLVEGAGGLLSPISDEDTVADLAADLGFPLLIVARLGLGTINHTLLTVEAAQQRRLPIAGIVLNEANSPVSDLEFQTNPAELGRMCNAPILGVLRQNQDSPVANGANNDIDWWALAKVGNSMVYETSLTDR